MYESVKGVGVIVGRFHTHMLTFGHKDLIRRVRDNHDRIVIFVGVNPVPSTRRNPLDFESRLVMIQEFCPEALIFPVVDNPSNEVWSEDLDKSIRTIVPFGKVTLYGGRDSFIKHYSGSFEIKEIAESQGRSATEYREVCASAPLKSQDFRRGVIYSVYNSFPRVNPTVDIAVTRDFPGTSGIYVLLGRKPGEKLWRFPGGFVDAEDVTLEAAAIRECHEETGLIVDNPKYICSRSLKDWRVTEGNGMVTTFFEANYIEGHAQAGDDLIEIEWHPLDGLLVEKMNKNHRVLMAELLLKKGIV